MLQLGVCLYCTYPNNHKTWVGDSTLSNSPSHKNLAGLYKTHTPLSSTDLCCRRVKSSTWFSANASVCACVSVTAQACADFASILRWGNSRENFLWYNCRQRWNCDNRREQGCGVYCCEQWKLIVIQFVWAIFVPSCFGLKGRWTI